MLEFDGKVDELSLNLAFGFIRPGTSVVVQDLSKTHNNEQDLAKRNGSDQKGRATKALVAAEKLLSSGSFDQNVLERGAHAAGRLERFDQELKLLNFLKADELGSARLAMQTGRCLLELDMADEAKGALESENNSTFTNKKDIAGKSDLLGEINGHWLRPEQTEIDCLKNPNAWWFAKRHIETLILNARFSEVFNFTDSLSERFPHGSSYLFQKRARVYLRLGSPQEAIDELERARGSGLQNESWVHAVQIKCHVKMGALETAHELLNKGEHLMPAIDAARIRAGIYELQGKDNLSLECLFFALAELPNLSNLSEIAYSLHQAGRFEELRSVEKFAEEKFPHSRTRQLVLAKMAMLQHNYRGALLCLEQLRAPHTFRECMPVLSDCYWHNGKLREAFLSGIAYSYFSSNIIKVNKGKIINELEQSVLLSNLKNKLISKIKTLETGGFDEVNSAKLSLAGMFSETSTIKQNTYDRGVGSVLATAARHELSGHYGKFVRIVENNFERIVSSVSSVKRVSGLCMRLSYAQKCLGEHGKSISSIEDACYYSKMDRSFQISYANAYRNAIPPADSNMKPETSILILSCVSNNKISSSLAGYLFALTGRKVFVVMGGRSGDDLPELLPMEYGFKILVPTPDDYAALAEKLTQAYRYLFLRTNCSGVLKIDDDISILNEKKFGSLLKALDAEQEDYVGALRNYASPVYHHTPSRRDKSNMVHANHGPGIYCDGGQGYYLSRKSLAAILEQSLTFFSRRDARMVYEDVWFSEMLHASGIEPAARSLPLVGGYVADCLEPLKTLGQLDRFEPGRFEKLFGLIGLPGSDRRSR